MSYDVRWGQSLAALVAFLRAHGGCYPVINSGDAAERALAQWVNTQKSTHAGARRARRGTLNLERAAQLEALSGWCWHGTVARPDRKPRGRPPHDMHGMPMIWSKGEWRAQEAEAEAGAEEWEQVEGGALGESEAGNKGQHGESQEKGRGTLAEADPHKVEEVAGRQSECAAVTVEHEQEHAQEATSLTTDSAEPKIKVMSFPRRAHSPGSLRPELPNLVGVARTAAHVAKAAIAAVAAVVDGSVIAARRC